ncbi:MAG: hypothetical protein ACLQM8_06710 [Limisphaerales bacterium]
MKIKTALLLMLATCAGSALAGPLAKENIDANAKWLLHLDVDQFRESRLGKFLIKDVLVKKMEEAKAGKNNLLTNLDAVKIIGQIHSLSAYGTSFETGANLNGVLLLQVEPETRKILEGLAAGLLLQGDGTLTKTNEAGVDLYSVKDQLFVSPQDKGLILLSKSKAMIKEAMAVRTDKSKSLLASKAFTDFPPIADSFIVLAVAEGFQDNLPIPPEAQVLRKADGARVVLGETTGNLLLNVALKAKDPAVLKQIQQVVEGILALASLSQSENKELQQLVQSVKVVATEKAVSVTAAFPVDSIIAKAGQMMADEQKRHHKAETSTAERPEADAADAKQPQH